MKTSLKSTQIYPFLPLPYIFGLTFAVLLSELSFSPIGTGTLRFLEILAFAAGIGWLIGILKCKSDYLSILFTTLAVGVSSFVPDSLVQSFSLVGLLLFTFMRTVCSPRKYLKMILTTISIVWLTLTLLLSVLGESFVDVQVVQTVPNHNGRLELVTRNYDAGATGGSTSVTIDRLYFGMFRQVVSKVYTGKWNEHPQVGWIDESTVRVDGKEYEAETGSIK